MSGGPLLDAEAVAVSAGQVRFGLAERWALAAAFGLLVFLLGWVFHNFDNRLDEQGKAMIDLSKQQAVMNDRLATLTTQLADIPGLTQRVAELQVRVERNTADIHELQNKGSRP